MFPQVGAHGTGAGIPPMDEQVVALTLVTPRRGTLHLSQVCRRWFLSQVPHHTD